METTANDIRTGNSILVRKLLQLRLAPGIDELVSECCIRSLGAGCGTGKLLLRLEVGQTRVAADRGDEFVTLHGAISGAPRASIGKVCHSQCWAGGLGTHECQATLSDRILQ